MAIEILSKRRKIITVFFMPTCLPVVVVVAEATPRIRWYKQVLTEGASAEKTMDLVESDLPLCNIG